jgi:hypothetical protein
MGLDVYLYKCPDRAVADAAEKLCDQFAGMAWGDREYATYSEEEKSEIRKKIRDFEALNGIDGFRHKSRQKVEISSEKYPDHYFKIGYFRSSYNDSGINHVLRTLDMPDLFQIFGQDDNGADEAPNWDASRERVLHVIESYRAHAEGQSGKFFVMSLADSIWPGNVTDEKSALKIFGEHHVEQQLSGRGTGDGYSCRDGDFFPGGLKIYALISGMHYGRKCVYGVFDGFNTDWYLHALEIVLETIDYVLSQPDKEQYYLSWSG